MEGFGILMIIFGAILSICGIDIYRGHNRELLLWRGYNPNRTKRELRQIGRALLIISSCLIITGIISLFFEEDSIIPIIILVVSLTLGIVLSIVINKKGK